MIVIVADRYEEVIGKALKILKERNIIACRISSSEFYKNLRINVAIGCSDYDLYLLWEGNKKRISSLWIKNLKFDPLVNNISESEFNKVAYDNIAQIQTESNEILNFILDKERVKTNILSNYSNRFLSKLDVIEKCITLGIKVPKSYLVNNKSDLEKIMKNHEIVIKNSWENHSFIKGNKTLIQEVERIRLSDLEFLPENFTPVFVQEYIDRFLELRVVFCIDQFYSMATYTLDDRVDVRYVRKLKRKFRFNIPEQIKKQILNLMKCYRIDLAAIDMIVTANGELHFLEMNPNGNISNALINCNFDYDISIANYLENSR